MKKTKVARRQAVAKQSKVINDILLRFVEHCQRCGSSQPQRYYVHVNKWINKAFNIEDRSVGLTPYQLELLKVFTPLLEERIDNFIVSGVDYHNVKDVVIKCLNDSVDVYVNRIKSIKITRMVLIKGGCNHAKAVVK
jgi:hypothetical protein